MSSMGLMQHGILQSEGSWKTPLMTLFALALYWPLFMLPLFPGEFFPQLPYASSNFTYSLLLFLVMLAGSLVLARRPNGLISFSRSAQVALCMLALILLAFVVLLLVFQKVGANPPLILFWLYPVVVGLYGVFLGVRMMFALACCEERLHAAIVLGSLLVSFVVGAIIPSVLQVCGLPYAGANYPMLLAAGGFAQILPKPDAKMFNVGLQSYTKRAFARNMLLVLMFVCYLFVSDMFMGSYVSRSSGVWFTGDALHLIIGFALYAVCSIGIFVEYRKERSSLSRSASGASSFFWGSFMLLLTIFLYCIALLNPVHVGLCAEIVLPSLPLAMVLLWLLGFEWARRSDRKIAQYIMVAIPLIIVGMNVVADAFGTMPFGNSGFMANTVNAVALAMAFLMAFFFFLWMILGVDGIYPQRGIEGASDGQEEAVRRLSSQYDLTQRECDVMRLLSKGHTQKRIAQDLGLSINSVQTYAKSLYRKMGVHSRQDLIDLVCDAKENE